MPNTELELKKQRLDAILDGYPRVLVALSGGVDSTYLLAACLDALGTDRVTALTIDSPLMPRDELDRAQEIARGLGARHEVVPFDELEIEPVVMNAPRRCYYCKQARFAAMVEYAAGIDNVVLVHGENADDRGMYRPGSQAAHEAGARAPLAEAGLTKADIRALARERDLPTWDQPAAACLATRFPYDTELTREGLKRVDAAERVLAQVVGAASLRVRDHFPIARIEIPLDLMPRLLQGRERGLIVERLRALGYRYVTLDLAGYRMGSYDDAIDTNR